jgi:IrrE N-terminal-like domain
MAVAEEREIVAARELLAEYAAVYALDGGDVVPVEDIAESYLGLFVRDEALEDGVSGVLRIRERLIGVNAAEGARWPRRRRFTIAHEVGHWVLHRDDIADLVVTRTIGYVPSDAAKAKTPEEIREREANRFAAELLMPEDRVHAAVDRDGADVLVQAERFQVSALSMAWRLFTYGYITRRPRRSDYDPLD